ncbi:MAG TPA: hypothetical protein VME69_06245, partial [Methylocella sp.]|nr:hypothetical protein [Methylocella sp.]
MLHIVPLPSLDPNLFAWQGTPRFASRQAKMAGEAVTNPFITNHHSRVGKHMVREFQYRGETWRVNAHGIPGHEEVFIIYFLD